MEKEHAHEWIKQMAGTLVCEIIKQMSGIRLQTCSSPPPDTKRDAMDAVYGLVDGDYRVQLQFRAEQSFFCSFAANMIGAPPEDELEVREYATEFFNVLCGRFISELYEVTHTSARFFPTQYEVPPNVSSLQGDGPLRTLYFISEKQEMVVFCWTAFPIDDLLRRSKND